MPGCKDKEQQQKIAAIESRMSALESNVDAINASIGELTMSYDVLVSNITIGAKVGATNTQSITDLMTELNAVLTVQEDEEQMFAAVTNRLLKPSATYPVYRSVVPPQTKEGVPIDIYNSIVAAAGEHWPDNYEMQEYQIKNQVEAYKELHPQ